MTSPRFAAVVIAITLITTLCADSASSDPTVARTVIVVRHAEKQLQEDDPGLTPAGVERSHRLRDLTLEAGVTAIFATQFRRTQATVRPLASALGLELALVDAEDTAALLARILAEPAGSVVVVAGHSNTVPALVAALGAPAPDAIEESDYGNLFIVTVPDTGRATSVHLRF